MFIHVDMANIMDIRRISIFLTHKNCLLGKRLLPSELGLLIRWQLRQRRRHILGEKESAISLDMGRQRTRNNLKKLKHWQELQ